MFVCWMSLRLLFGKEGVEVREDHLVLRRRPFGVERKYALPEVLNVRVVEGEEVKARLWLYRGFKRGPLAFDYGASTVRFGDGLDLPEARRLAALIERYVGRG